MAKRPKDLPKDPKESKVKKGEGKRPKESMGAYGQDMGRKKKPRST